jgi:hypothetical protein
MAAEAAALGRPPVRQSCEYSWLDEVHLRIAGLLKCLLEEVVVGPDLVDLLGPALHGLEQHQVLGDVLVDQVQRQQRMDAGW